jgi:hypothetical protein
MEEALIIIQKLRAIKDREGRPTPYHEIAMALNSKVIMPPVGNVQWHQQVVKDICEKVLVDNLLLGNHQALLVEIFYLLKEANFNSDMSRYGVDVLEQISKCQNCMVTKYRKVYACENAHPLKVIFYVTYNVREKEYQLFSSNVKEYDKPFLRTNDRDLILKTVDLLIARDL